MKNLLTIEGGLIIAGAIVLLLAIIRAVPILGLAESKTYRRNWIVSIFLMCVFLATYISLLFLMDKMPLTGLITTSVLFLGSVFVYVIASTGYLTLKGIRQSETSFAEDISMREKTRQHLSDTSILLQTTFDLAFDGILAVDSQGKIITYNKRFAEMWRIPEEILASKDDKKAIDFVLQQLKDPGKFVDKVKELYSKPEEESFDVLEFKDGRTFERYSKPEKRNGNIFGRVWDFVDITDKKKAERQLKESNDRFSQIFNLSPVALVISTLDKGEFILVNKKFADLTGYKSDELIGNSSLLLNIISSEEREKIVSAVKEDNKHPGEFETQIKTQNGDLRDVLISSERIDLGDNICIATALVDITFQKDSERRIAASEKTFMQMFNFSPVPLSISRIEDGKLIYVNEAFNKTLGFTGDEVVGKTSEELGILSIEQRAQVKKLILKKGGHIKDMETVVSKKGGRKIQVLFSIEMLEINGEDCALIAFVDISGIRNSEGNIRAILENIGEGVIVSDTNKNVIHYNQKAAEILGMDGIPYSSLWSNKYELFYPDERTIFPVQNFPLEKAVVGEATAESEIVLIDRKSHKRILLRVAGHPILSGDKQIIAAVVTLKDITQLRETEKALKETELKYRNSIGFKTELKET